MLINAGIEEIIFEAGYDDPLADQMLKEAGVKVRRFIP
jgi:deoxycytidylate deaminase